MGAFNEVEFDATCPVCGQQARIRCQTHMASSMGGDENGRFCLRSYRIGDRMAWWDPADPRYPEWRAGNCLEPPCDPDPACDREACYGQCLRCNAELYVILRVCDLVIVEHLEIGPAANWPRGYFA